MNLITSVSAFIIVVILLNNHNKNPATAFITGIRYAAFTQNVLKENLVGGRQKSKNNIPELEIPTMQTSEKNVQLLPSFSNLKLLWSFFISLIFVLILSIPLGLFGLTTQSNTICPISFISLFIILRFGFMTTSNSKESRKFGVLFALVFSSIFYCVISQVSLYSIDPRPLIQAQIQLPKWTVDMIISIVVSYLAFSLSYPSMKHHHVYHSIKNLTPEIYQWQLCMNEFKAILGWRRSAIVFLHNFMPITSIIFIFLRHFIINYFENDSVLDSVFLSIELIYAVLYIFITKNELRIILNDSYKYLSIFNIKRTSENGKQFNSVLNRSLSMIPTYCMALLTYPMAVIACCLIYVASFFMDGLAMEASRVVSIFVIVLMELIMSTNKVTSFMFSEK